MYSFHALIKADNMLTYEELTPEIMAEYTIIVHTTPVGMFLSRFLPEYPNLNTQTICSTICYIIRMLPFLWKKGEA